MLDRLPRQESSLWTMILRFWQNKWQKRLIPKDDPSPPLSFLSSQISTKTIILGSETVIGKPGTVTIRPSARRQGWETVNTCSISSTLPHHPLTTSIRAPTKQRILSFQCTLNSSIAVFSNSGPGEPQTILLLDVSQIKKTWINSPAL